MIAIIDYGVGNLFSLSSSLRFLGLESLVTSDPFDLSRASHIILPGVGAFGDAMRRLHASGLAAPLLKAAESPCSASALACRCCLRAAMNMVNTPAWG